MEKQYQSSMLKRCLFLQILGQISLLDVASFPHWNAKLFTNSDAYHIHSCIFISYIFPLIHIVYIVLPLVGSFWWSLKVKVAFSPVAPSVLTLNHDAAGSRIFFMFCQNRLRNMTHTAYHEIMSYHNSPVSREIASAGSSKPKYSLHYECFSWSRNFNLIVP